MILLLVIGILVLFLVYLFVVKPQITGYVVNAQNQGYAFAIASVMQQAATCQAIPLTLGNQTMNLVWIDCLQQQPQQ
jgi:hypothetical protein